MNLSVQLIRSYRSKNGNKTFVYAVSGSTEAIEAYKEAQGDFHRTDDDGKSLWFTTRCIGESGKLIITSTGKVAPDMSDYDQMASLAEQYGGDLGQELARAAAQKLMGRKGGATPPPSEGGDDSQDVGNL